MRRFRFGVALAGTLGLTSMFMALAGTPENPKTEKTAVSVALSEDHYRAVNFTVACYSAGRAAVLGEEGILKISMLVRMSPFREWIAVYYDPKRITEEKLLALLRERRCASAKVDRIETAPLTVMNPFVGPGDVVQLRVDTRKTPRVTKVKLPEDWAIVGKPGGSSGSEGLTYFTIQVPSKADLGKRKVILCIEEGEPLEATVEVVQRQL